MPTILDRDLATAQADGVRAIGRPALRAVIDHGVGVFERCSQTAPDGDANLGVLMPFHHALEMLDGVEVLLDSSCVVAARTSLRSAFEASLGLRYVLESDFEQRALAYVVADLKERIRWYEEMDPDTEAGQRFREVMGVSEETSDFPFPTPDHCRAQSENLSEMLDEDGFKDISEEYDATAERRKRPPWYSLFGGPANLRELAVHMGEGDSYLVLYRTWSRTTHGTDLYRQLTAGPDGVPSVRVIRCPLEMPTVYALASGIGVKAARAVLGHYRSGELEQASRWYLTEVSPVQERLEAMEEEVE